MIVQRYDKSVILDYAETTDGYLTVNAPITRPGVFPYQKVDGGIEMEAKLPEELFSCDTVKSAEAKPITDEHPHEPVTVANYAKYAKGMTHTDASVKDNKLCVSFTITDPEMIQKVKNGKRELSIGFLADVEKRKGSYDGMQYDSVQKNMLINHVAIVDKGRAGPSIAIRGDSAAYMIDHADNKNQGGKNMPVIKLDSVEYEVDAAVKANFEALQARLDAANEKVKAYDVLQGKHDALETKLVDKEKELAQAKLKADGLDEAIETRIELVTKSKMVLGDSFEYTGKTDRQIKEEVIKQSKKDFKADGKSDEYVNAFYDAITEQVESKGFITPLVTPGSSSTRTDVDEMRNKRLNMREVK